MMSVTRDLPAIFQQICACCLYGLALRYVARKYERNRILLFGALTIMLFLLMVPDSLEIL